MRARKKTLAKTQDKSWVAIKHTQYYTQYRQNMAPYNIPNNAIANAMNSYIRIARVISYRRWSRGWGGAVPSTTPSTPHIAHAAWLHMTWEGAYLFLHAHTSHTTRRQHQKSHLHITAHLRRQPSVIATRNNPFL